MAFFASAIDTLKILVIALGAGLGAWGVVNLLEGYGNDNPGAKDLAVSLPFHFISCAIFFVIFLYTRLSFA